MDRRKNANRTGQFFAHSTRVETRDTSRISRRRVTSSTRKPGSVPSFSQVREKDIRNFIGAMSGDTTKGVFVTTSTFDDYAVKKAHDAHHKIILIDGKKLIELMYQYGVGTQVKNVYEVKEIDEDFFEST